MKDFWNDRYRQSGYAYGTAPNLFFKEQITGLPPGKLLMPADGEGRNGVFAARLGWEVTSTDLSEEGRVKALALAADAGVKLDYQVGDMEALTFEDASFDAIVLIYAHFEEHAKATIFRRLNTFLKPGGTLIVEAFRKEHLSYKAANPKVGGPDELGMLYSAAELKAGFPDHEILLLDEIDVALEEGPYHQGIGAVVRFVGRKKTL